MTIPSLPLSSHSWQQRMDVVARFMLLGNMRVVSEQSNIPLNTLYSWKNEPWWLEMVDQIRRQKKQKTADSLTSIIETGVDILNDRLENGDFVLNQKTGEIQRKPVGVKEATVIVNQLIQRQNELEKLADNTTSSGENVQDTLTMLAKEFEKITRKLSKVDAQTIEFKTIDGDANAVHDART